VFASQLEAIIRISESITKIALQPTVQMHHVEEAIRLFKFSTMDAVSVGSVEGLSRGELHQEMTAIEKELRKRLPVGWTTSYQSLMKEFVTNQGYTAHALERCLFVLEKSEVIKFQGQRKVVCRWVAFSFFICSRALMSASESECKAQIFVLRLTTFRSVYSIPFSYWLYHQFRTRCPCTRRAVLSEARRRSSKAPVLDCTYNIDHLCRHILLPGL
jgi:hypothetical protein